MDDSLGSRLRLALIVVCLLVMLSPVITGYRKLWLPVAGAVAIGFAMSTTSG